MDSIYFEDPLGLLIELASYRFEPPSGFTHADVLLEAHKLRVERGDYNIDADPPRGRDRDPRGALARVALGRRPLAQGSLPRGLGGLGVAQLGRLPRRGQAPGELVAERVDRDADLVSESRSRSVTVSSSIVWSSTVTPQGVPISSWRR